MNQQLPAAEFRPYRESRSVGVDVKLDCRRHAGED